MIKQITNYLSGGSEFWDDLRTQPLSVWLRVHRESSLAPLIKRQGRKEVTPDDLVKVWHKINNQYLSSFGLEEKTKRLYQKRKSVALALASYLETGDRAFELEASILIAEIKSEFETKDEKQEKKSDDFSGGLEDLLTKVERFFGFQIDEKKTTTFKFYNYVRDLKEESNRIKKQQAQKTLKNG